jgi:hypothetical protein
MSALQGWNPDPFGRFDDRYFSDGTPTALVRSGMRESRDDPGVRTAELDPVTAAEPGPEPLGLRPHLYERRTRRGRAAVVFGVAILLPFVAWELLTTTTRDRVFGLVAFVVVIATLVAVLRVFRTPRTAHDLPRPFGKTTIAP